MNDNIRPSDQLVSVECAEKCGKPLYVKQKDIKTKWGHRFRHKECYLKMRKGWNSPII